MLGLMRTVTTTTECRFRDWSTPTYGILSTEALEYISTSAISFQLTELESAQEEIHRKIQLYVELKVPAHSNLRNWTDGNETKDEDKRVTVATYISSWPFPSKK